MRFETYKQTVTRLLLGFLLLLLLSCLEFRKYDFMVHPGSPMVIKEIDGDHARVFIYEEASNSLVEYGWVELETGWTLTEFDWAAYIEKRENDG
jgi:hypothetical protein